MQFALLRTAQFLVVARDFRGQLFKLASRRVEFGRQFLSILHGHPSIGRQLFYQNRPNQSCEQPTENRSGQPRRAR